MLGLTTQQSLGKCAGLLACQVRLCILQKQDLCFVKYFELCGPFLETPNSFLTMAGRHPKMFVQEYSDSPMGQPVFHGINLGNYNL